MHKYLLYSAYGWLALSGALHFVVDVASQYFRGKREPGLETTLYYGLNTAFSLGQVAFGIFGVLLAWRARGLLSETPVQILSIAAALGWLAITFMFMEYWEPKLNAGIFLALVAAAIVTDDRIAFRPAFDANDGASLDSRTASSGSPDSMMISGTACPRPRLDARMRRSTRIGLDVHSTPSYPGKTGGHRMKYGIVRQIANLAFQLDDNPEHVYRWINDEHVPALGDRRPIELIWEDQGELVLSFLSDLIGRTAPSTASSGGWDHSKRVSSPDIPQTQRAPTLA